MLPMTTSGFSSKNYPDTQFLKQFVFCGIFLYEAARAAERARYLILKSGFFFFLRDKAFKV